MFGDPRLPGALGLALLHFCWQGCLIGGLVAGGLARLRDRAAEVRHAVCLLGMVAMIASPLVTAGVILADPSRIPAGTWLHVPGLQVGTFLTVASSPVLAVITWLWLAGASILQLRMIVSWLWVGHIRRTACTSIPQSWHTELHALSARMRVSAAVRIAESRLVRVPCVVGWLRPVVLVPFGVAAELSPAQLRGILAHELAHIRRHDFLVNLLQCTFESLLFFHPVTWWLSRRLRTEREFCCDDIALTVTGDAMSYARALVRLDEIRSWVPRPALSSNGGNLMQRITRIFEKDDPARLSRRRWLPVGLAVLGLTALVVVASTGCLGSRDTTAADFVGPAPAEASAPAAAADRETMLAHLTERIEACRTSGRIAPQVADAVLAKIAQGEVELRSGTCCGQPGMVATFHCGPQGCAGAAGAACGSGECPAAAGAACRPTDCKGVPSADGATCMIEVALASGGETD